MRVPGLDPGRTSPAMTMPSDRHQSGSNDAAGNSPLRDYIKGAGSKRANSLSGMNF
jgi:hypothetical protein